MPVSLGLAPPLFAAPRSGRPTRTPTPRPERPEVADRRCLDLESGRRLRSRVAGIFLFLPLLARLRFDQLITQAGSPGTAMIPAARAVLSLLALKLLDKERRSHISDFNCDEGLGLFAGLNVLPKTAFATEYSYRTQRAHQQRLLAGWIAALAPQLFPDGRCFALDFHAIPFRGDASALDTHYLPRRGKAGPSLLCFFAQEQDSRVVCSANATLTRADQPGELMRFVEFWHEVTGHDPRWLYFDSKVVPYPELSRINQRGIHFVTIRRRGAAVIRRLRALPSQAWQHAVIDTPRRRHQQIRFVDEQVRLPGYEGSIRQLAVEGLGREQPTLFLSNNLAETARALVIRYAGRNGVEDGLGSSVNFFHLDCLASEVRLNVDLDATLTVLGHDCYRWLARGLKGFDRCAPKQVYRKCVETAGEVEIQEGRIVVRLDRRSHNPILREAALDHQCPPVPWLNNLPITFNYT
ncbi:MAG TPA: hypothetical protein VKP69_28260 [Isosphaeraceae bacterium]|nr:hypothetical protein [Isosphaeraceae bacterium]